MAIKNVQLIRECFLEHLRMPTATLKSEEETEEEDKQKRVKWKKIQFS